MEKSTRVGSCEGSRQVRSNIHIGLSHLFEMPFIFSKLLQDASRLLVLQTEVREMIFFFFKCNETRTTKIQGQRKFNGFYDFQRAKLSIQSSF